MLNFTFIYVHNFVQYPFFARSMEETFICIHIFIHGKMERTVFFLEIVTLMYVHYDGVCDQHKWTRCCDGRAFFPFQSSDMCDYY